MHRAVKNSASFRREERRDAKWDTAPNIVYDIRARPFPPPFPRGIVYQGVVIQRNRLDLRAAAMQLAFSRHSIKY